MGARASIQSRLFQVLLQHTGHAASRDAASELVHENRRFGPAEITNQRIAEDKEVDALARRSKLCPWNDWGGPRPGFQAVRIFLKDGRQLEAWRERDDVINPDAYYQNARKLVIHRAVPVWDYEVSHVFPCVELAEGLNTLYVRVTQANGQMAWSSPIWVQAGGP